MTPTDAAEGRTAFREGALAGDLADLASVRFAGIRCRDCGTALLGRRRRCENCSSQNVADEVFASRGTVHTFTVQRYPPPAPFDAPTPWVPRAVAWIDLEGRGPRILAPISGPAEAVSIGVPVLAEFDVQWRDEQGREVVAFSFRPTRDGETP